MVPFKFSLIRFDIFFKGVQNHRAKTLLDIVGIKTPVCLNRITSYIMFIYFLDSFYRRRN